MTGFQPRPAQEWDERYAGKELLWSAEPNRFVAEELADLPPGDALDLAAGEGRNAVWLAERGWRVTAVDFSAVGLDKGRQLAAARGVTLTWVQADLAAYQPAPGSVDLVVVAYLHAGADLLARVLAMAVAALRPGGTLLVVGHDRDNLAHGYGGPQEPSVLYSVDDVVAHLGAMTVERAEQVRRAVTTPEGTPATAIDTLVRARKPAPGT